MKELNNYIIEKLKLNKDSEDPEYIKFCNALKITKDNIDTDCWDNAMKYSKELYKYYQSDCKEVFDETDLEEKNMLCGLFDALFILAIMLLQDEYDSNGILKIGFKSYKGNNNPYDYSWFDEENDKNQTILELIQDAYHDSNKFKQFFDNFYDLAGHIWELTGITPDDICDFFDKMTS